MVIVPWIRGLALAEQSQETRGSGIWLWVSTLALTERLHNYPHVVCDTARLPQHWRHQRLPILQMWNLRLQGLSHRSKVMQQVLVLGQYLVTGKSPVFLHEGERI